jgi:hypothetical protein
MREAEGYNIVKIRPCRDKVFVQIEKLVRMGEFEALHELMTEDEGWLIACEAAERLVKPGDRGGYNFPSVDDHMPGAYFLLKKDILPHEGTELDDR